MSCFSNGHIKKLTSFIVYQLIHISHFEEVEVILAQILHAGADMLLFKKV